MSGSSPRLWGACRRPGTAPRTPRFIPTPVGSICTASCATWAASVHPHACGEHTGLVQIDAWTFGSSPRLWGAWLPLRLRAGRCRFIPTPVGSIHPRPARSCRVSVHPHACGEHALPSSPVACRCGSSPRLWGAFLGHFRQLLRPRFIPTPVGSMVFTPVLIRATAVHPHACGEHSWLESTRLVPCGSSPRLWGAY